MLINLYHVRVDPINTSINVDKVRGALSCVTTWEQHSKDSTQNGGTGEEDSPGSQGGGPGRRGYLLE